MPLWVSTTSDTFIFLPSSFHRAFSHSCSCVNNCGTAVIDAFKRIQDNGIKKKEKEKYPCLLVYTPVTCRFPLNLFLFSARMKSMYWVSDLCLLTLKSGFYPDYTVSILSGNSAETSKERLQNESGKMKKKKKSRAQYYRDLFFSIISFLMFHEEDYEIKIILSGSSKYWEKQWYILIKWNYYGPLRNISISLHLVLYVSIIIIIIKYFIILNC